MAIAAAALPPGAGIAAEPHMAQAKADSAEDMGKSISPLMTKLSTYMSEARTRVLPGEVVENIKLHVLDTLGAIISGTEMPTGPVALKYARTFAGKGDATVIASKFLCSPLDAALINGTLAHADETDDVHETGSHLGSAVLPATLAVGEQFGIDGTHFIRAVSLGYDLIPRMLAAFGGTAVLRSASFVTVFGAAAAAGCAANLNEEQMRWVIDYTTQQASGIHTWLRDIDHIEKGFCLGGMPARDGATAALLVRSGWTGIADALSGTYNLFESYQPNKPEEVINKLGEVYGVMGTSIKKWSVGHPMQAPLDAMYYLMQEHPFQPHQVKQVVVRSTRTDVVNNRDMPDICLQHMFAVMMMDKTATFHSAHDKPRMKDPDILQLRAKVQLIEDEEFKRRGLRQGAVVEVTLNDGTQFTKRAEAVRGSPKNPMTSDEISGKARELIAPVLGASTATKLIEKVLKLENAKDIRELRPLLQKA
jgi:2-methylcitrate dehydratase PrpD